MALPISYHWRHLFVRKTTTLLTVLVIASVVGVFAWLLGFAGALSRSLSMASDERLLIILKTGATAESNSAIPVEDYNRLSQVQAIARDPKSREPLESQEMLVQVSLPRIRDGGATFANVAVRGVMLQALGVHRNVRLREGRWFDPGAQEVVVGESASKQFGGLRLGDIVNLGYGGNRGYTVAGLFSAGGAPVESEIWGYLPSLLNSYNRTMYSSVNLRLRDDADPKAVVRQIEGPAIQLAAKTEAEYWQGQSETIRTYLGICSALVIIMCLAAAFSIANTMFSSVAGRMQEIAMLRTIGFSPAQIQTGFVVESIMLALLGGVLGCAGCAAWLLIAGSTKDMFAANTFTSLAFDIRLTPMIVAEALAAVALVGAVGALAPARRAARLQVITALREP